MTPFSIALGGPLYAVYRRCHLVRASTALTTRRIAAFIAVTWLPLVVLSAVNEVDTSALFALTGLNAMLKTRGVALHLAEVKGPVMDRLKHSEFLPALNGRVFLSTAMAWDALAY